MTLDEVAAALHVVALAVTDRDADLAAVVRMLARHCEEIHAGEPAYQQSAIALGR